MKCTSCGANNPIEDDLHLKKSMEANAALCAALEWYGQEKNHDGSTMISVPGDRGRLARKFLNSYRALMAEAFPDEQQT